MRIARFLGGHLGYMALAPLLMFAGTAIHELAHAGAVILLGGEVTDITLLPTRGPGGIRFGATYYRGDLGDLNWVVTMAPALIWTLLATLSLGWLGRLRGWLAKSALLFLFVLPLTDIALQLGGLYSGRPGSDYYKVLAGHELATTAVALVYFGSFLLLGWRRIFVPVFGRVALSPIEYGAAALLLLAATPVTIACFL